MAFHKQIEVQPHSHAAQAGIILKGQLSLTIHVENEKPSTMIYSPGDLYYIPAETLHSACIIPSQEGYMDFTFFDQNNRYGKFAEKNASDSSDNKHCGIKRTQ